ncbi:hypothetical protein, partial [Flavobacterium sp.]|uniref:hypothetical protein n=1 Tax=Flavobacterium sp. TaxID=239 RepID=UPI0037B81D4D
MKRILFFVLIIGMSINGYAQDEFMTNFKPIPPKNKNLKIKKEVPPKPDLPKIIPPIVLKPVPIAPIDIFENINLYKKEENSKGIFYRKNQNLGTFKTTSTTSKIRYRDAAFVDGDKIKVYLNNKVIQPEVLLEGEFKGFEIKLENGNNRIDFEALNEGFAAPNTAQFQVYDDKGILISASTWNLGTGFKASIILVKE